ncbi:uridine kinase [Candidatus Poribacteria bacterium]|nr:uridine kinase [Candidatus Poribacteria bacterium]
MTTAPKSTPILIGIAGGSGSGKTTLAGAIHARLGAQKSVLLNLDGYYKDLSHLSPADRGRVNFDHPDALDMVLFTRQMRQLKSGQTIETPSYDFTTHTRQPQTQMVSPTPIVLVEGMLLMAIDSVRSLFDLKVFVDTPADIRFIRRLERDIRERGRTVDSVIQQYRSSVRPMHLAFVEPSQTFADIIVSGEEPVETLTAILIERIEKLPMKPSEGSEPRSKIGA